MPLPASLPFFSSRIVLQSDDLQEMAAFQSDQVNQTRLFARADMRPEVTMSLVEMSGVRFFGLQIRRKFVRDTDNPATDVGFAVMFSGTANILSHEESIDLSTGDCLISLPSDTGIQESTDVLAIIARTSMHGAAMLQLRAMPFSSRKLLSRKLSPEVAGDLSRTLLFFAEEYDRTSSREGQVPGEHILQLAGFVKRRLTQVCMEHVGVREVEHEEALRICLACDALLRENEFRVTVEQLASNALCSIRQVHRAFETLLDISPSAYAWRTRLQHVRADLLRTSGTNQPPSEIAAKFGFNVYPRFLKSYEIEFGESPSDTQSRKERLLRSTVKASLGTNVIHS